MQRTAVRWLAHRVHTSNDIGHREHPGADTVCRRARLSRRRKLHRALRPHDKHGRLRSRSRHHAPQSLLRPAAGTMEHYGCGNVPQTWAIQRRRRDDAAGRGCAERGRSGRFTGRQHANRHQRWTNPSNLRHASWTATAHATRVLNTNTRHHERHQRAAGGGGCPPQHL